MVPGKKYRSNSTNPSTSSFGPGDLIDCLSFPAVTLSLFFSLSLSLSLLHFPLSLSLSLLLLLLLLHRNTCTHRHTYIQRDVLVLLSLSLCLPFSHLCLPRTGIGTQEFSFSLSFPRRPPPSFASYPFDCLPPPFSKTLILSQRVYLSFLLFSSLDGSSSELSSSATNDRRLTCPANFASCSTKRRVVIYYYVIEEQEREGRPPREGQSGESRRRGGKRERQGRGKDDGDEGETRGKRRHGEREVNGVGARGGKGRDSWTGASANVLFKAVGVAAAS